MKREEEKGEEVRAKSIYLSMNVRMRSGGNKRVKLSTKYMIYDKRTIGFELKNVRYV